MLLRQMGHSIMYITLPIEVPDKVNGYGSDIISNFFSI